MVEPTGWLDAGTFETVVASTPLISIDLLVENERGEYLLGLRRNRPAQGYWFVPGGRVQKSESLDEAFRRLTRMELGVELERSRARFKGVYEHFYRDSVFGENVCTHYIVLAYCLSLDPPILNLSGSQHLNWEWLIPGYLDSEKVHCYTRAYFEY